MSQDDKTREGELVSPAPQIHIVETQKPKRFFSGFVTFALLLIGLFVILSFSRQFIDSIFDRLAQQKVVHTDESFVETEIEAQVKPKIAFVLRHDAEGQPVRVMLDAEQYSQFVRTHVDTLEKVKKNTLASVKKQLQQEVSTVFLPLVDRVDLFADWYFAYTTTYKILWEASTSAVQHTLSLEGQNLTDAVAQDVETYLEAHYSDIVLRPETTHPQLQKQYIKVLEAAHRDYINSLAILEAKFQVFIAEHTTHINEANTQQLNLQLDWESQIKKLNVSAYDKGVSSAMSGAAFAAGGGVAGKAIGGALGKGLVAKLSAPFVTKAVLAGGGGAIGSLGGPVGAGVGIVAGLGVDYAINESLALMQRDQLVEDMKLALMVTQITWEEVLQENIDHHIGIWFEDAIQLLPRYDKTHH